MADTRITPVPPEEIKESHGWRDWFKKIHVLLQNVEHEGGHWYLTNGGRHAIVTSAGITTTNVVVANTTTETTLYTYTFLPNELHADERVICELSGVVSNASAADDYTIKVYLGGTLLQTLARAGGNVTDAGWEFTYSGTVRTEGTSGTIVTHSTFLEGSLGYSKGVTTTTAINTTISEEFKVTITWAAAKAGNTITQTQGSLTFLH